MQTITKYINHNGGVNNLQVAQVLNHRLQPVKTFTSLKDLANQRAAAWVRKFSKIQVEAEQYQ